jgi:hypothetical protein
MGLNYGARVKYAARLGYYFQVRDYNEYPDLEGHFSGWWRPTSDYYRTVDRAEEAAKFWISEHEKQLTFTKIVE